MDALIQIAAMVEVGNHDTGKGEFVVHQIISSIEFIQLSGTRASKPQSIDSRYDIH